MLARVGQALLDRATQRELERLRDVVRCARLDEFDLAPQRAVRIDELRDILENAFSRDARAPWRGRLPQRGDGAPGFGQTLGRERTRIVDLRRPPTPVSPGFEQRVDGIKLDDQPAEAVREDIVDVVGDLLARGEDIRPGLLLDEFARTDTRRGRTAGGKGQPRKATTNPRRHRDDAQRRNRREHVARR